MTKTADPNCLSQRLLPAEGDRGAQRVQRAASASGVAAIAKAISIATPLLTIPMTLAYLGSARFGAWAAVSSTIAMMSFADLGIGNGLLTRVSHSLGREDLAGASRYVSSAYALLCTLVLVFGLSFAVVFPHISLFRLFNAPAGLESELRTLVSVVLGWFLANLVLGLIQKAQLACQEGAATSVWQCAGSIVAILTTIAAVRLKASLPWLALAALLPGSAASLGNTLVFFLRSHKQLQPTPRMVQSAAVVDLLRLGLAFVSLNLLLVISLQCDNFIVARVFGVERVAYFSVVMRISNLLTAVPAMVFLPYWSAYGEAIARGDTAWVLSNTTVLTRWSAVLTACASSAFVLFGNVVGRAWLGSRFHVSFGLLLSVALGAVLTAASGPRFMILNAAADLSGQIKLFLIYTPVALLLKVVLARQVGIQGVTWGGVVPYAFLIVPFVYGRANRILAFRPVSPGL